MKHHRISMALMPMEKELFKKYAERDGYEHYQQWMKEILKKYCYSRKTAETQEEIKNTNNE